MKDRLYGPYLDRLIDMQGIGVLTCLPQPILS